MILVLILPLTLLLFVVSKVTTVSSQQSENSFMHNIDDVSYDQVNIYYTNTDSLLNKLDKLEVV